MKKCKSSGGDVRTPDACVEQLKGKENKKTTTTTHKFDERIHLKASDGDSGGGGGNQMEPSERDGIAESSFFCNACYYSL